MFVIDPDHGRPGVSGGEQRGLRLEVLLHVVVEVEMIPPQVQEGRHLELQRVRPGHGHGVAGHLDGHGLRAPLPHQGQQRLEIR